jgi:hypothetical protein|tara:strand:- start:10785 stop:11564 length:780 start_codon:yes stop_codon:yes gene_type:complete
VAKGKSCNDRKLLNFNSREAFGHNQISLDIPLINEHGYQVIRRYGTDIVRFEQDLSDLSKGKLFYSERIGSICHRYRVLPGSKNFSEQLNCGGYHTDFMFQPNPPAFIAMLCLEPDPKYPFYGRNQVVSLGKFIEKVQDLSGISEEDLRKQKLHYSLPGHGEYSQSLLDSLGGKIIFRFHELLIDQRFCESELLPKENFIKFLHSVFMDVSEDICLDRGDILIVSNHHALHRRSECSISYMGSTSQIKSREMASIRFNL